MSETIPDPPGSSQPPSTEPSTACGEDLDLWRVSEHPEPSPVDVQLTELANRVRVLSLIVGGIQSAPAVLRSVARALEAIADQARAERER